MDRSTAPSRTWLAASLSLILAAPSPAAAQAASPLSQRKGPVSPLVPLAPQGQTLAPVPPAAAPPQAPQPPAPQPPAPQPPALPAPHGPKDLGGKVGGPRIRGFADLHNHQFGNLGFGGLAFWGQPFGPPEQALQWCTPAHGAGGAGDIIGNLMGAVAYEQGHAAGHLVGGHPQYDGWPRWNSLTHQSVHEDWLKRAHDGGLQLMVMLAVNNEFLCSLVNRAPGRTCDDDEAVRLQLGAARNMQAWIDQKHGGAGRGWYRIVTTPAEARAAIAAGQLAVVLGVEVDNVFRCRGRDCLAEAQRRVDELHQLGVRHVYPLHFSDNQLGGASFDKPQLQGATNVFANNPPRREVELKKPYQMAIENCSAEGYLNWGGGFCNVRGLTGEGRAFLRQMMHRGMIIDVDHMSRRTFNDAIQLARAAGGYPVVSGHTGFTGVSLGDKKHEGQLTPQRLQDIRSVGGMVALILHQGGLHGIGHHRGPGQPEIPHACGNSSETFAQAWLYALSMTGGDPVGIGTDMNGFAGLPSPRRGPEACNEGRAPGYAPRSPTMYPFVALANARSMDRSVVGRKTFDVNDDGMAHMGMLPDFIADLQSIGVTPQLLEPLMSSAEGYIRLWERAVALRAPPAEPAECGAVRNGLALARANPTSQAELDFQECVASGRKPNQCREGAEQTAQQRQQAAQQRQAQIAQLESRARQLGCL